jgi:hypothetical protein
LNEEYNKNAVSENMMINHIHLVILSEKYDIDYLKLKYFWKILNYCNMISLEYKLEELRNLFIVEIFSSVDFYFNNIISWFNYLKINNFNKFKIQFEKLCNGMYYYSVPSIGKYEN